MRDFVLIPGTWMGAWAWEPVTSGLHSRGHRAHPVTLAGLGDPREDVSGIGLDDHVEQVLALLREQDLRRAVVVGHSYSGIVAGMVADRAPERVAHTVFVEGTLPRDGISMLDTFPEWQRADEIALIADNGGRWPVPDEVVVADSQDLPAESARWLVERFVGHPGRTITEPATMRRPLEDLRATYVVCRKDHFAGRLAADVEAMRAAPNWAFRDLDTGLWPMLSAPDDLVEILDEIACGD